MKRVVLVAALLATMAPSMVQSQEGGAAAPAAPGGAGPGGASDTSGVQFKSKTVYDFDDDTVEGDLVRPDGEFIDTRRAAKHSSLIRIRENFITEMLKSAEDI